MLTVIVAHLVPDSRRRSPDHDHPGGDPRSWSLKTVKVLGVAVCTGLGTWNRAVKPPALVGRQAPARGFLGAPGGGGGAIYRYAPHA